jgi:hypothetical protein
MANDRELLELRTVEVKHQSVTVSYPKHLCSRSHAWSHLEHNYPPQVPTKMQLGIRTHYNPWRRSHTVTHWSWYWHSRVAPRCLNPIRGKTIHPVYADSRYTHKSGCLLVAVNTPSRKLGVTFTSKPCKMIGFGNPTLFEPEIRVVDTPKGDGFKVFDHLKKEMDELYKKAAVPAEMLKGRR